MFAVTVIFEIEPAEAQNFLTHMKRNASLSVSEEPGCRQFDVCWNADLPEKVFLYELYDDKSAFDAHRAMPHYADFNTAIEGLVTGKTVSTYDMVSQ